MTNETRDEIRKRCDAAMLKKFENLVTPGEGGSGIGYYRNGIFYLDVTCTEDDIKFIKHAKKDIYALLDALDSQGKSNDEAEAKK